MLKKESEKGDSMIDFLNRSTEEIARQLLGKKLIHKTELAIYSGYITETEAYLGVDDQACHTFGGRRTPKVTSMYDIGGTIYIYTMHTHNMLNIVTKEKDDPQAVLIRAIEPAEGLEFMEKNRNLSGVQVSNGPGKLTKAMEITKALDGKMIGTCSLSIDEEHMKTPLQIIETPRIGIPNKGKWTAAHLRYYVRGNPFVTGLAKREWDITTQGWT